MNGSFFLCEGHSDYASTGGERIKKLKNSL